MADTTKIRSDTAVRQADRAPRAADRPQLKGDWSFKGDHRPLLRWLPRAGS